MWLRYDEDENEKVVIPKTNLKIYPTIMYTRDVFFCIEFSHTHTPYYTIKYKFKLDANHDMKIASHHLMKIAPCHEMKIAPSRKGQV